MVFYIIWNAGCLFEKNAWINQTITHFYYPNLLLSLDTNACSTEWLAYVISSSVSSMKLQHQQEWDVR